MNFTKLVSLFAFVTLAVLSLGMASAQSCVVMSGPSIPTSISNTAGTFQATFNLAVASTCSANRTINTISLNSSTASGNTGSWTVNTNLPIVLDGPNHITSTITTTFTIPATASGILGTSINIGATVPSSGQTENYIFVLPAVAVTPSSTSSNLTISVPTSPVAINQNATLIVTNTGTSSLLVTMSQQSSSISGLTFLPPSFTLATQNSFQEVKAILSSLTGLKFGSNTVNVQATAGSQVRTASFEVKKTFCSAGEITNSNLTINSVDWNNDGEGDENSWELLDEIELDVEVKNNNNDDDIDAVVVLGLFDSSGNDVADELTFLDDSDSDSEEIEINIDEDSDETVTFKFKVPADFDADNYKLAVKVYNDDAGQARDCRDSSNDFDNNFYHSIAVEQTSDEGHFIAIDDIELESQVTCGQTVTGQFTVFNVGEDDQDRVRITIKNSALNINEVLEITSDLDKGDDETLDFRIQIPTTVENGNYGLEFFTEYDYKNGVYRQDADESFDYNLEVIGCSGNLGNPGTGSLTNLEIDAELDSEAKAGKELIVTATIKNTGTEDATYSLSARGYSSWAELVDISDSTISVDAGESKEVIFTLLVNEDAKGTQAFDIQAASDGRVQIQEVEVELSSGASSLINIGSPMIWVIGLVNLVLIILIIVVVVKMSRR